MFIARPFFPRGNEAMEPVSVRSAERIAECISGAGNNLDNWVIPSLKEAQAEADKLVETLREAVELKERLGKK